MRPSLAENRPIGTPIEDLVRAYGARVMSLLVRLLAERSDAEDAYQDTWYALWRARSRLAPGRDAWPFVRQTAVRKAVDLRRRLQARPEEITGSEFPAPARGPVPREPLDLGCLGPRERACLVLHFWEEMTVTEIAVELDVPEGTVKTWMFRGRARLKATLEAGRRQREML